MSCYHLLPRPRLAIAFPPQHGLAGACTTLVDLCRAAYLNPHFFSRREVAQLIFARNLEVFAPGKGNRAARRAAMIETARWFDDLPPLTDADLKAIYDDMGDNALEARTHRISNFVNIHE